MKARTICWSTCLGTGLFLAASAVRADDLQLDENVTWSAFAQESVIPASVDLSIEVADGAEIDNLVVRFRRMDIKLSADTVETSVTRVYRYGTLEGVRDYGNIRTYFDATSDAVNVQHAMVVDSKGDIHVVEPGTVQILPSDTFNVFSDSRYALIPLKGLDVGATAIVINTITTDRNNDIGPWGMSLYEQYAVPQERLEIQISWTSPKFRPEWHSQLDNMSCTESDRGSLSCVATGIPAYPTGENTYYDDVVPQFVVAEKKSWADIRVWYQRLFESALSADGSIVDTAARLSDGLESETKILEAIHNFVATKVRYVGLEHGDSAYVPHPTSTTLGRRYGDCKDKAALLIDLLHHVGIEMSPVLVSTTRRETGKLVVPTRNYFDHLIVCGTLSNGREYCLDGTDPYTGIESLSGWVQGAVALPIVGDSTPTRLPASRYAWVMREDLGLTLTETGDLQERGGMEYGGTYGTSIRRNLSGLSSEELQDWAVKDYHGAVSDLVDPSFRFAGIDETGTDLAVSWDVMYTDLLLPSEDLDYSERSSWLNQAINSLRTENDVYDYRYPGLQYESVATVDVNSIWEVDYTGPDIDMQSRFGEFRRIYDINGQTVTVTTSFAAPATVIKADDVAHFNRFMDIIQEEGKLRVMGALRDVD